MDEVRLLESLARSGRRLRWRRVVESSARAARPAALASLGFTLGAKVLGLEWPDVAWGALPLVAVPLAVALAVGARRPSPACVAAGLDAQFDLQERLSTAVEWILARRPQSLMSRAQLQDAVESVEGIPAGVAFPVRRPRAWWLPLAVVPALVLLCALPPWHLFRRPAESIDVAAVGAQAARIDQAGKELARPRGASEMSREERQRLARQLRALARELASPGTARRQALADLGATREALQKALREIQERLASRQGAASSPAAGSEKSSRSPGGGSTAERLRALAEQLRRDGPVSASRALDQELARQEGGASSHGRLRRALEEARRSLGQGQAGKAAEQLEQEAQAEAEGERESAADQQAMEEAMRQVEGASAAMGGGSEKGPPGEGQRGEGAQARGEELFREAGRPAESVEGKGRMAPDFGVGTTHQEEGSQRTVERRQAFVKRESQERSRWTEAWRRLYQARRVAVKRGATRMQGQVTGQGSSTSTREHVRGVGGAGDRSILDEGAVYEDGRRRAEEAVARSSIPQEYRDLVRNYFEDIAPREKASGGNGRGGDPPAERGR